MEEKLIKELLKKFNIRPLPSNQEMYSALKNTEKIRPMTARGPKESEFTARKVEGDRILTSRK